VQSLGLLLVDHGSRNAAANETLDAIAQLVRERMPDGALVRVAHMELCTPTIAEALATLIEEGATQLVVMPYFLAPGRHSTEDVPRMVREAMVAHPTIAFRVTEPLGVHALLAELVIARVVESGR
jgi:sirohydrochlorin ferrochelatase